MDRIHDEVANTLALFNHRIKNENNNVEGEFDGMINALANTFSHYNKIDPDTFITACNREIT